MRVVNYKTRLSDEGSVVLIRDKAINYSTESKIMNTPSKIAKLFRDVYEMNLLSEEYAYMACFDTKYHLIGVMEISHGSINSTIVNNREIFQKALLCNAYTIVVVHNHPSYDTSPSHQDIEICQKIKQGGELIGVSLSDFIIIGGQDHLSFRENNLI